jgi:hypothetical protein
MTHSRETYFAAVRSRTGTGAPLHIGARTPFQAHCRCSRGTLSFEVARDDSRFDGLQLVGTHKVGSHLRGDRDFPMAA